MQELHGVMGEFNKLSKKEIILIFFNSFRRQKQRDTPPTHFEMSITLMSKLDNGCIC